MPAIAALIAAVVAQVSQFLFKNKGSVVAGGAMIGVVTVIRHFFGSWVALWEFITTTAANLRDSATGFLSSLQSLINSIDLDPYVGYLGFVNYVLPVQEVLVLTLLVFGICGSIRAARWVKSFVPTIGD